MREGRKESGRGGGVSKATPMMSQYWRLKERCGDAILMFRLGDFYEMFFEDAERASTILDIALTSRNKNDPEPIPLCGVPFHSVEPYIARLLNAGLKVAICEQVEDPKKAKGLVERDVVRIITPGTVLDEGTLEPGLSSFLVAVCPATEELAGPWALAAVDFSTGALKVATVDCRASCDGLTGGDALLQELTRLEAREILLPGNARALAERLGAAGASPCLSYAPADWFSREAAERWFEKRAERPAQLDDLQVAALGGLLSYLEQSLQASTAHLSSPQVYSPAEVLVVDEITRAHLGLIPGAGTPRSHSLLAVLDRTVTPMGSRTIRSWLLYPLVEPVVARRRLDAVEAFLESYGLRSRLLEHLNGVGDLERLAGRLGAGSATPRDLVRLADALEQTGPIKTELTKAELPGQSLGSEGKGGGFSDPPDSIVAGIWHEIDPLPQVVEKIRAVLDESAGARANAGGVIRSGYHDEVDELRRLARDSKQVIAELEARERSRSRISTLKVRYNRVFGYYIEVSRANLHLVPADYVRKQTLVGAERFITAELKECESRLLGAEERLRELEAELFADLVREVAEAQGKISRSARALGALDALLSLAEVAHERGYVRPHLDESRQLLIREGRHPVVEAACTGERFVPNDCSLDPAEQQIVLLTGPNMAGKSTYLRQVALITIMAQMGSFVPASEARIGVVDRIFTRVGASDNLAAGESTFMVEMRETARILSGVTSRSLLVLDEIGRGTSTFDGIAIAWSVIEYLHDGCGACPKTLFATHFYELTDLARSLGRLRNYSVAVREWKEDIVFLRQVVPGPASRSYGIQVARLAGLPGEVIDRAKEVLLSLEQGNANLVGGQTLAGKGAGTDAGAQLELFARAESRLRERLAEIDVSEITPLDAMLRLAELIEEARRGEGVGGGGKEKGRAR